MQEFQYLQMQLQLQRGMQEINPDAGTKDPYQMGHAELEVFIHWNFMALIKELGEATDETSWKPWASGEFVNYPACIHEMVDAWHFFMNIMLAMGAMAKVPVNDLAQEFQEYYIKKNAKNLQRQVDGYDGVTDKCPYCHRDLGELDHSAQLFKVMHSAGTMCSQACAQSYDRQQERQGTYG